MNTFPNGERREGKSRENMARSVFYSFHYQNDISRVNVVRNHWVTQGTQTITGVIDHADFEAVQRKGDKAVKDWIDGQLSGTTATVVLIGSETLSRPYVQYEIQESYNRGNAVIGVHIHNIKDLSGNTAISQSDYTMVNINGKMTLFREVADSIYDWVLNDGYHNLGTWVEEAVLKHGR